MKVAIVNYGMGNLASVKRVLEDLGAEPFIAEGPASLADAASSHRAKAPASPPPLRRGSTSRTRCLRNSAYLISS